MAAPSTLKVLCLSPAKAQGCTESDLKLTFEKIRQFCRRMPLHEGSLDYGWKHFRVDALNVHWAKLNRFENRIHAD